MEPTSDTILGYLASTLEPAQRAAIEARLARDPAFAARVDRLRFAIDSVRSDARHPVPAAVIEAAKDLGRRLSAARAPSLFERLSAEVRALVLRLTYDSRLEGALAGLRGGSGFALTFDLDGVELEIECDALEADRFAFMGQISGIACTAVEAFLETEDAGRAARVAEAPVDRDGVFRLILASGRYLLRFHTPNGPLDAGGIDVP